ncbi:glycosyl hydrolase family 61-domain-containing protein [Schizophyllum amplum]|uniref:AA9 family lytic polysaccharide monooxygenase n=1 Tax=Schizophyllum amplum TaxID=97359 RepID=A0A550CJ43_9AGAR|nr:glycosyl hydrolase family 61-domain-containing protein [Auriculariopsis ampla]
MLKLASLVALLPFLASVHAHGQLFDVYADGVTKSAPNVYYDGDRVNSDTPIRKMYKSSAEAYVLPGDFSDNSKMSCEGYGSAGAPSSLSVAAGSSVTLQWSGATSELTWVTSVPDGAQAWVHGTGPVMNYLASCDGDCNTADVTNAGWTKIDEFGIDFSQSISDNLRNALASKPEPYYPEGSGLWGVAKLVQDGSKWTVNIPSGLAPGGYILRHEMYALHNPKKDGDNTSGPQGYIACVQLDVTGSGSTYLPEGTQAGQLYDPNGDFANFDLYQPDQISSFQTPGPAIWDGVTGGSSSGDSGSNNSGSSSGDASSTSELTEPSSTSESIEPTSSAEETASAPASTNTKQCRQRKRSAKRAHAKRSHANRLGAEVFGLSH